MSGDRSDRIEGLVRTSRELLDRMPALRSLGHLWPVVFRIQADGRTVTVEEVAAITGRPADDVAEVLRDSLGIEPGSEGHRIGDPRLPGHRVHLEGATCPSGARLRDRRPVRRFAGRAARPGHVTLSRHRTAGHCRPGARRVTRAQSEGAVVSLLPTGDTADLGASICLHGHCFASAEAAADWQADHPDGAVVSMADAFRYIEGVFGEFRAPAEMTR